MEEVILYWTLLRLPNSERSSKFLQTENINFFNIKKTQPNSLIRNLPFQSAFEACVCPHGLTCCSVKNPKNPDTGNCCAVHESLGYSSLLFAVVMAVSERWEKFPSLWRNTNRTLSCLVQAAVLCFFFFCLFFNLFWRGILIPFSLDPLGGG